MAHWQKVSLSRHKCKKPEKTYTYWCLRWFGSNGVHHGQSIGRADGPRRLSRRRAELLRGRKEQEINEHPNRRDMVRSFTLSRFLRMYLDSRIPELAPGTLQLHNQTAKYLLVYFGENCRIDQITRSEARMFKAALADNKLKDVSKRPKNIKPATVDMHIRNSRTMFNRAIEDDIVLFNPFEKLSKVVRVKKDWRYIKLDEFYRLLHACPNQAWQTLLTLCRLAGLRQGEALTLTWRDVNWENERLTVWAPKTKKARVIPIAPELLPLLRDAFESAKEGERFVVSNLSRTNLWRDFQGICRRADIKPWEKWCQTLRKNREQDWNKVFPRHIVCAWMGHSEQVAQEHYLKVYESDMTMARLTPIDSELAKKVAQKSQNKGLDKKEKDCITLL